MIRLLSALLFLCASVASGFAATDSAEVNDRAKKARPPKPEAGGLRLEVNARLDDYMPWTPGEGYTWEGAFLDVEVALHNVSSEPITVATTAYNEKPFAQNEPGLEYIVLSIGPDRFQGRSTAFVAARFTPVVLAPNESVLLFKYRDTIKDRKRADALKEVSVVFLVSSAFTGPKEWWRGRLLTYAPILREEEPDEYMARGNAASARYAAEKEAEKDPNYGATNAARVAALIASADEVSIRGELEETKGEVIVRDPKWIRQVSEAIAATRLPRSSHCFCTGWRTAYFKKNGEQAISMAAIHGNQLRIHWDEGGGDYKISEADWKTIKEALEITVASGPSEMGP